MSRSIEPFTVSPTKVHVLSADATEVDVEDTIEDAEIQVDPSKRSIRVAAGSRVEEGNIEGEPIASGRGLKIICGRDGDDRKSLHLAFSERGELDDLLHRLEGGGISVVRSRDDPDYRTED